jgi:hypothetical protein
MIIQFPGPPAPDHAPRGRLQTYALVAAALAAGALLIAFGLIVLAGLAVTGTVVGGAIGLYHRFTGRWPKFLHVRTYSGAIGTPEVSAAAVHGLDPAKEVFPPRSAPPRLRASGSDSDPDA